MTVRRLIACSASVLMTATIGCGSNHSTDPIATGADTVTATTALTGYILAYDCTGTCTNHRTWFGNDTATVGDNNTDVFPSSMRAVITFALPTLPTGATFRTATLDMVQCRVDSNPFTALGVVIADHLVPTATPDSATYDTTALADSVATVATAPTTTPVAIPLTSSVEADYTAGHATTMYRLRFDLRDYDNQEVSKNVAFCGPTVATPTLVITYVP
jgi:hypothetical protein